MIDSNWEALIELLEQIRVKDDRIDELLRLTRIKDEQIQTLRATLIELDR